MRKGKSARGYLIKRAGKPVSVVCGDGYSCYAVSCPNQARVIVYWPHIISSANPEVLGYCPDCAKHIIEGTKDFAEILGEATAVGLMPK